MQSINWCLLISLTAACLVATALTGFAGPRYQHRFGPFSLPDALFTIPLSFTFVLWLFAGCPFPVAISANAMLAGVMLTLALMALVPIRGLWFWVQRLPANIQDQVSYQCKLSRLRKIVRCGTWLGCLFFVLHLLNWQHPGIPIIGAGIAAAFGSALAAPLRLTILRQTRGRTVYDSVLRPFDVFVSYKSHDVHVVRDVVNELLAAGLRVWFAEYTILLVDRSRFDEFIRRGLRNARYGLLFTNDRYAESRHCQLELEELLGPKGCGAENVLEIRIPDEPRTRERYGAEMEGVHWMTYDGNVASILEFVSSQTDLLVGPEPTIGRQPARAVSAEPIVRYEDTQCYLDTEGWNIVAHGGTLPTGDVQSPQYIRYFGNVQATFNLIVGPDTSATRASVIEGEAIDDRQAYNDLMDFAWTWLGKTTFECKGVHLFFFEGYSHLALTYWTGQTWSRRYAVVLPHPKTGQNTEFAFSFAVRGSFRSYCKHAHEMDRIVLSLRWRSE